MKDWRILRSDESCTTYLSNMLFASIFQLVTPFMDTVESRVCLLYSLNIAQEDCLVDGVLDFLLDFSTSMQCTPFSKVSFCFIKVNIESLIFYNCRSHLPPKSSLYIGISECTLTLCPTTCFRKKSTYWTAFLTFINVGRFSRYSIMYTYLSFVFSFNFTECVRTLQRNCNTFLW